MSDTPNTRYDAYLGFFLIGIVVFLLSLLAGWLETLYIVFFFLAGVNLIFTTGRPPEDPTHSTTEHYEIYSRDNVFNYILAAVIVLEAVLVMLIPVSKALLVLIMWGFNVAAYPRLVTYFSERLAVMFVGSYLREHINEITPKQIDQSVAALKAKPDTTAGELASQLGYAEKYAAELIVLFNKYLNNNDL